MKMKHFCNKNYKPLTLGYIISLFMITLFPVVSIIIIILSLIEMNIFYILFGVFAAIISTIFAIPIYMWGVFFKEEYIYVPLNYFQKKLGQFDTKIMYSEIEEVVFQQNGFAQRLVQIVEIKLKHKKKSAYIHVKPFTKRQVHSIINEITNRKDNTRDNVL